MNSENKLPQLLYGTSILGISICTLLILYFMTFAILGLFGVPEKGRGLTFEVPISLNEPSAYFHPKSLDASFSVSHIEIQKANLEVKPQAKAYFQSLGYFHASLYVGFFLGILIFLAKLLKYVKEGDPFNPGNSYSIRNIGLLSIGLGVYEFLFMFGITRFFHHKFTLDHGHTLEYPSIWDMNLVAIFLGLVFISLSQVFKHGFELQDLESQTV